VNVGLTLEGMTDGLCKANVHRVIFPQSAPGVLPKNRRSIAYFSTPSHDIVSACEAMRWLITKIMNAVRPGGVIVETQGWSFDAVVVSN
jgi:isopenicillin N synthase-like dioxygenase